METWEHVYSLWNGNMGTHEITVEWKLGTCVITVEWKLGTHVFTVEWKHGNTCNHCGMETREDMYSL